MKTLYEELRSEKNLFSAWRHVKRKALGSKEPTIRGKASEFEHNHQRHLKRIAAQLREGRFKFDMATGYPADIKKRKAKGKDPRPIVVRTIKDRIVERAILQVLQPRKVKNAQDVYSRFIPVHDPRLGKLNLINCSSYGVGGLMAPYGGVQPGIKIVLDAMSKGGRFYYQSDIKSFFTKIRTSEVVEKILKATQDEKLTNLFAEALKINLADTGAHISYAKIFPANGIGVAQGSSLSTFAGNVLLYDLDHSLNEMGVTAVRYIDDLVVIAKENNDLQAAIKYASAQLSQHGFDLYPITSEKASTGKCENSLTFLGCTIQPNRCVPSTTSVKSILKQVDEAISDSKCAIKEYIERGKVIDSKKSQTATIDIIGKKLFGWQKSFSFCSDSTQFKYIDGKVEGKITSYMQWINARSQNLGAREKMPILGIPNTYEMHNQEGASLVQA
ncbi:hypothetical protein GCM10017044_06000 [Kordiimonas sediminis]|uniref:Reverse transcriptase domain-containing protein n=1 Tax=Kordiimonas sediminis TaxID=1735581 RepID=A0A919ALM2_9PROT|nr:reverse transcriptase domain-containing protein [Kordiimonas sediminis]GHF14701.1 hypothetical protein GCM10017044_06000 [Kordiimonas sediminis]